MCGFGGIINAPKNISLEQATDIAGKVFFRGPDNTSIRFYNQDLQPDHSGVNMMFFNRLAIMDLDKRSNQPFENNRYTLLFNGEIYNFRKLLVILQSKGYLFRTTSDTEVLFYALQEWGIKALEMVNGMFAFFWMDRTEKKFLLARDRMGIKPLYYSQQNKSLVFGSEMDSILRLSGSKAEIEPSAGPMYLWMQFIPTPYTMVKGVFKLPPGHYITGSMDEIKLRQIIKCRSFWDAYTVGESRTTSFIDADLEEVLKDSLSRQLLADVPLGLFLSSGVDSSLLVALINKYFSKSRSFDLFTVAFSENTKSDESKDALNFIKSFNNPALISHTLTLGIETIGTLLDHLYDFFDEPFGDETALLNLAISRKARDHVSVAISGDGADELFWGYKRYDSWQNPHLHILDRRSNPIRLPFILRHYLPGKQRKAKVALELEPNPLYRHFSLFLDPVLYPLMKDPIWEKHIWAIRGNENFKNTTDLTAWMDIKTYLPDAMLYKVDRASMAASLEVRVPYLDNLVVDYALAMPFSKKSNNQFRHKAALKKLLQQLAPHYNVHRNKKGFNFPLDKWLRFGWKDKVYNLVTKENLVFLGLDEKVYLNMVKAYYDGDKSYCKPVWYLFNLALWGEKFKKIIPL